MEKRISNIWAKTDNKENSNWHPLILHMIDVAACAGVILDREPEYVRTRMAAILGMRWSDARSWILLLVACHDLGKACPSFQFKWPDLLPLTQLQLPRRKDAYINHGFVGQIALMGILIDQGWPDGLADLTADAVGCHHGCRASEYDKDSAIAEISIGRGERLRGVRSDWSKVRQDLFEALRDVFHPGKCPNKKSISGPDFMLLSGLTSFSDWIGSNEDWFSYGTIEECEDLIGWLRKRTDIAANALDSLGWHDRITLLTEPKTFQQVFDFTPRPLQQAIADVLPEVTEPSVFLVEAPMGEGKTEAAFFAYLGLQRSLGHRGLYVALPTKATGNAMFARTLKFLQRMGTGRKLDLQLLHGAALLNDTFQNLRLSGVCDQDSGGEIRAAEWFTNKKRALLSEYGVGTADQAMIPILPVRHNFVRLWGLANRVVIFDEIHAYDAYTGTLLIHLLRWLLALGSSVVLLSATLPPSTRRKLADLVHSEIPEHEKGYPRLSVFRDKSIVQKQFEADSSRRLVIKVKKLSPELTEMYSALKMYLKGGGLGLAIVNTVQRAQDLYLLYPKGVPLIYGGDIVGKQLSDGTKIFLFHARFPANERQKREEQVLKAFGEDANREGLKILIATQVAEQSLDLDFDLILTDLAPIDLVLQRAGRLWRHKRDTRPISEPVLIIAGLSGSEPSSFAKPLWWSSVYHEDLLLRTWCLLQHKKIITLPDEIDYLVQAVYEEQVEMPENLQDRMQKALVEGDGDNIAKHWQANQAIIGLPDDASWNDPGRFVLYDEDEPGVHRTLMAQTRLGGDSVVAIPLWLEDGYQNQIVPNFPQAKRWFLRAVSLTRNCVVKKLKTAGIPEGWKKSSLLRNCYPLVMDPQGAWTEDSSVRLDGELGIVYEAKEKE